MVRRMTLAASALAAAWLSAGSAQAGGGLSVSPITIEFSPRQLSRTLEVANPGDAPVHVQLRLFAWTGGGTEEHHAPSRDIGFSPPMFELAPGQKQVVRLVAATAPARETAYRLFVDQIQPATGEGGVSMPVRMALPLFVGPDRADPAAVDWRIEPAAEGGPLLIARNRGGRRLKVSALSLDTPAGAQSVAPGLAGYVLAGQERAWRLTSAPSVTRIPIHALTEQGPLSAPVAPD